MTVHQLHKLEDTVGLKFLGYVLNYNGSMQTHQELQAYGFTNEQYVGAEYLLNRLEWTSATLRRSEEVNYTGLVGEFNRVRQQCGGQRPALPERMDPLRHYLLNKAVDYYPVMLLKPVEALSRHWYRTGLSRISPTMLDTKRVHDLLKHDPLLRVLLRGDGDGSFEWVEYELDNSIRVRTFLHSFVPDLLEGAFAACCYRGHYAVGDLIREVEGDVSRLRDIAAGGSISVFHFRGLYGLRLKDADVLDLGQGTTIRNIDDPSNPYQQGTMSQLTTDEHGTLPMGCILEHRETASAVPVDLAAQRWTISLTHFEKVTDDFIMAVILSGKRKRAPICKTFRDVHAPLFRLPSQREEARGEPTVIVESEIESVSRWFNLLQTVDADSARIPLGRIRAALFARDHPVDSLLDFFIAWESMFSTRVSTMNSVVRSLQVMLARAGHIIELKRLRELYGMRSAIVHGTDDERSHHELLTPEAQLAAHNLVGEIALVALSELLKDSELLPLKPQERVERLLQPSKVRCDSCQETRLRFV